MIGILCFIIFETSKVVKWDSTWHIGEPSSVSLWSQSILNNGSLHLMQTSAHSFSPKSFRIIQIALLSHPSQKKHVYSYSSASSCMPAYILLIQLDEPTISSNCITRSKAHLPSSPFTHLPKAPIKTDHGWRHSEGGTFSTKLIALSKSPARLKISTMQVWWFGVGLIW